MSVYVSMVSLWHVGACRGIISLVRIGVTCKYDDPGCNIIGAIWAITVVMVNNFKWG